MFAEEFTQVQSIIYEDDSVQIVETPIGAKKAILYKTIMHAVKPGDDIVVNVTATNLHLGTGGYDFVKSVEQTGRYVSKELTRQDGHILKLRYTPYQHQVLAIEAQESPYHSLFEQPFSLAGKPVLLGELHSMIPLVYATTQILKGNARVCVIIDDQAALPLAVSTMMRQLMKKKSFMTITVGQAFGGSFEAITIQTALQFAHNHLHADVIMISVGPGVVGTGTHYGFTGMSLASWSNIVASLKGLPVWIPRISFSDPRPRHFGISHHTLTPLKEFSLAKSLLPLPVFTGHRKVRIKEQLKELEWAKVMPDIQWVCEKQMTPLTEEALTASDVVIKTMGRGYQEDPSFFLSVVSSVWTSFNLGSE
ncbi:DUF3866 family protein [Bacillus sp. FJAT-45037]|uniref:DUF3866 family protein n=1 Tax=Bacillus sp. FJAT-45037 TaxID=2011007 RepID=UPI000C24EE15|nr:DUF3866 family protein [Bacillus sp. FJAT-45037]